MAFFDAPMFSPQTYAGQGDRWLDLFKMMQTQVQPGSFPDLPGMNANAQAALPPNAQPTQGAMPISAAQPVAQPQQAENPLMTGLQGFIGNLHNGPIGAIAGGLGGLITGKRTDPGGIAEQQANLTQRALQAKGFDADLAKVVASDPGLLRAVLPNLLGTAGQTDDIKEYQFAKKEEPGLTFQQFMQRKRAVSGEVGLTPIWGTGPDGKPAYIQPGKDGVARLAKMPEGFNIARDAVKVDAGDSWVLLDPQTRQPVATVKKNLEAKESAEERGKIQGQAQGELPAVELSVKRSISKVDELLNDKGFNEVFGVLDQYRPNWTMSDDGRRALTRFTQMEGTAFLEGRQMLKGGGAITDFESKKAEGAIARLSRSLSESDARAALEDFKDAVQAGLEKLRAKARGGASPSAPPAAPQRIRLNADGTIAQ